MTDVTGDVGVAKVELDYPDVRFIDYFTLARVGGEWKIIHKSFQRQPKTVLRARPGTSLKGPSWFTPGSSGSA